ncbi:hypothetical protein C8T65DRAFT_710611 [Cerioporus squamosus]|nr:hypothetical protein C8T65DRAFT_710611 [Cerioporus squamosus]
MAAANAQVELSTSPSDAAHGWSGHDTVEDNDDESTQTGWHEPEPEQDEEIWYPDGKIILSAGNVLFRVPQPPKTALGEDCPVVQLWDSPHDLRHLLRLLMPAQTPSPFGPRAEDRTFSALAAWIRLGHKYEMHALMEDTLNYLRPYYPADFDDWLRRDDPDGTYVGIYAIGVVNLARLTGTHTLLPAALLECSRLIGDVLNGFCYEDGTWEWLSNEDMQLCITAKDALVQNYTAASLFILNNETLPSHCKSPAACKADVQRALHNPSNTAMLNGLVYAETKVWRSFVNGLPICALCRRSVWGKYVSRRLDFWQRLPSLLGISVPGWDTGEETTMEEGDDA